MAKLEVKYDNEIWTWYERKKRRAEGSEVRNVRTWTG